MMADKKLDIDDVVAEISFLVEEAHQFMYSEFSDKWETNEIYYEGDCDLPLDAGRSSIVRTEVRDIIRGLMPSVMRTLLHSRKPVVFRPSSIRQAAFVEQQSQWCQQTFYANSGYTQLYMAILEGFKHGLGLLKVWWDEDPIPEFFTVTAITRADVMQYMDQPDVVVTDVSVHEYPENSPFEGSSNRETLYDIKATRYYENGRLRFEAFPIYEFFVQRNATNLDEFVHGHRRSVTVREAIELGIGDDGTDWSAFDDADPEENDANAASTVRRGYDPSGTTEADVDPLNKKFLLSEAYCYYDMDGDGISEKYCFYLGGTSYKYISHYQVEDFCIAPVIPDLNAFTVVGRSVTDIAKQSQDNLTSLLRIIMDNAHIANNPRAAGDPSRVDFEDLMNNAIGAPIKTKGSPDIQVFEVPFTAGNLLPMLQYLGVESENRMGVTKAATGLDPDAMQSTDKNAVMNTIQLAQGQSELIVRNIIETGLIPIFRKMLRLSIRHMSPIQLMQYKGAVVPVDISAFDPDLLAEPTVGLGTASPEQKMQTLSFIYGEQTKFMQTYGLDNPFTSLSQVYNTIEDMIELGGIYNVGRYFNYVGKEEEQVIAKQLAEQAKKQAEMAQANQPADPSKTMFAIESMKARLRQTEILAEQRRVELELQQRAMEAAEKADLERDKLAQNRVIELSKLRQGDINMAMDAKIKAEQDGTKPKTVTAPREQTSAPSGQAVIEQ